ncbi:MAG TPA: beta-ketoacyl synthase chain length factor [Luteimonas sp.]|nr:beta-ketoacyl synthase chain length factor [Luteimonas sp.]
MITLSATLEGVGFWCNGLPSWQAARDYARSGALPETAPAKPSPQLLPPNERRRAPDTVAVALEVAMAACVAAGRDPKTLPSVFASTHGELAITDYMAATLAADPRAISPTRFHNSVHNAAAGYWTIGTGCHAPTTAITSLDASFAQGLVEALAQLAAGEEAVLLAAYDSAASGPLTTMWDSRGLLGGAMVLSNATKPGALRFRATLGAGEPPAATGPLARLAAGNAMAPMLPLFDALALDTAHTSGSAILHAGPGRVLRVEWADA